MASGACACAHLFVYGRPLHGLNFAGAKLAFDEKVVAAIAASSVHSH